MDRITLSPTLPSESESILARETSRLLAQRASETDPLTLRLAGDQVDVRLPASAVKMLIHILDEMARGNAVTLIPIHAELTTQQAADMLGVSRPTLIQLLDGGKVEYRRIGTHRRVKFDSLMKFKRTLEADRRAALAELAAYDQELGL